MPLLSLLSIQAGSCGSSNAYANQHNRTTKTSGTLTLELTNNPWNAKITVKSYSGFEGESDH